MTKRLVAEFLGTFWLVLGGCGSAVLAANFGGEGNPLGIGLLGVSFAHFCRRPPVSWRCAPEWAPLESRRHSG